MCNFNANPDENPADGHDLGMTGTQPTSTWGISITSEDVWQALCMIKASKACFGHLTKDMLMEYGSPLLERIRELIEKELNAARWSIETSKLILIPKGSGGIRPLGIYYLL